MRIAVVADDLYPGFGGQAAATEGHIEALLGLGHEVRALAGSSPTPSAPPEGVLLARLPAWQPGAKQTQLAYPSRAALEPLLEWAEVLQVNTPTPLAYVALRQARALGVPSVMGFHTQEESLTAHVGRARAVVAPALRRWYRFLYRQPDCLVAPTPFAARLARRYTDKPVHVVSNGIRLSAEPAEAERAAMRARFAAGHRYLLAYVGRLAQEKAPGRLLELMSALVPRRPDTRLVVAGSGPLREALEAESRARSLAGQVHFAGFLSEADKAALLWAADAFLMPSPTELQSIATLEAMACGCAVVAVDEPSSAVGEMVEAAACGLTYAPDRPAAAAADLVELLVDGERLDEAQRNARHFAARHDVRESGLELERLYRALLAERGAARRHAPLGAL